MNKKRVLIYGGIALAIAAPLAVAGLGSAAATQPAFICPDGGGWMKVDGPFGQAVFAPAPEGQLIVEVCYKAGTNNLTYTVEPVEGVSITSTLVNNGGQVADISHYSVRLVPVPDPTPDPTPTVTPTVTPTPDPTPTVTPTPDPTRTPEPTPFPPLDPPSPPTLPSTGLGPWFWGLLTAGLGFGVLGTWLVRRKSGVKRVSGEV